MRFVLARSIRIVLAVGASFLAALAFLAAMGEVAGPSTSLQSWLGPLGVTTAVKLGGVLDRGGVGGVVLVLWVLAMTVLAVPTLAIALMGEALGRRGITFYGVGCGALAVVTVLYLGGFRVVDGTATGPVPLLLLSLAGVISGTAYWLLAGRRAVPFVRFSRSE